MLSCGVGFVSLATSISLAAPWERVYSGSTESHIDTISTSALHIDPLHAVQPYVANQQSANDFDLTITTDNPARAIASAANAVLREDGKRYRVTLTVETISTESNEGKL